MITEIYDLETLSNLFTYTGYCLQNKQWYQFVIHKERNDAELLYAHLKRDKVMFQVGFNNENFDYPLEHYFLINYNSKFKYFTGQDIAVDLYNKAQNLINSEEYTAIKDSNKFIKQYDLFQIWHYNNKARMTSLKDLEFAMQMENIEEMPFNHNTWIKTKNEIDSVLAYNKNDVLATKLFLEATLGLTEYSQYKGKNKINLRSELSKKFNIDCHNWPDVKIGEQLMLTLYSRETNQSQWDVKNTRTERTSIALKDCIPEWCDIKTKEFNNFLNLISKTTLKKNENFETSIIFHGIRFDFGLGGTHGCIKSGIYESDDTYIIYDLDVSSLYPSIAKSLNLYPAHLGPEFTKLYSKFIEDRIAEKHKPKDKRDQVLIEGYKLILNGTYGKSNEETSFLYDSLYTYKTTIGGQLFIAMWAERMVEAVPNLEFMQINTDGITIRLKRTDVDKIKEVCNQLTKETTLEIEDAYYSKMIIRDVNNYISVYEDSTKDNEHIKLKGVFVDDVEYHQNSSMKIVPIALKNYFVYNIPIEDTIRNHKNIYDFCLRLKINSSSIGEWHSIDKDIIKITKLNRTTRYFISKKGGGLVVYYNGSKSPGRINKGFNTTLFNKYYYSKDYNINFNFYETECRKIINTIEDKQLTLF